MAKPSNSQQETLDDLPLGMLDEPEDLDTPENYRSFIGQMEKLPASAQRNQAIKRARENLRRSLPKKS